jgi:hypothetical protein
MLGRQRFNVIGNPDVEPKDISICHDTVT